MTIEQRREYKDAYNYNKNLMDPTLTTVTYDSKNYFIKSFGDFNLITIEELKEKVDIVDFIKFCKKNSIDYKDFV